MDIIDGEFGMTGSIQVMVSDISADQAEEIADRSQPQTIYSEVPKVWGAPRGAPLFVHVSGNRQLSAVGKENVAYLCQVKNFRTFTLRNGDVVECLNGGFTVGIQLPALVEHQGFHLADIQNGIEYIGFRKVDHMLLILKA